MFSDCNTISELNFKRSKIATVENMTEVNNAYNARALEIRSASSEFKPLLRRPFKPNEVQMVTCIPYCGPSQEAGVITLTPQGFYA